MHQFVWFSRKNLIGIMGSLGRKFPLPLTKFLGFGLFWGASHCGPCRLKGMTLLSTIVGGMNKKYMGQFAKASLTMLEFHGKNRWNKPGKTQSIMIVSQGEQTGGSKNPRPELHWQPGSGGSFFWPSLFWPLRDFFWFFFAKFGFYGPKLP